MFVVKYRKIFYAFSAIMLAISIFAMVKFGFNWGIDFKGGSIVEVSYNQRPDTDMVKSKIDNLSIGAYTLQPMGNNNFVLRTKDLSQEEKNSVINALASGSTTAMKIERFNTVGPVIGSELRSKAYVAIGMVILGIVLFITFAFRKVSKPVASWKYGFATIIALLHDVVIPTGIFIIFIKLYGGEIDILFVTAILAILGYSVHDTIVVFDRVRENLRLQHDYGNKEDFETTVGKSVAQTFGRSINTSLTIFLVLLALYFLGGETTKNFSFILLIGVIFGTYSSIFIASPLLVTMWKMQEKKTAKTKK